MSEMFIPTLHSFAMENTFTGSVGLFRFRIVPQIQMRTPKEVDFESSIMSAEFWHGQFCYEKSEMEGKAEFPLSVEGRQALMDWLKSNI